MHDAEKERRFSPEPAAHLEQLRCLTTAEANRFLGFARGYLEKLRIYSEDSPPYIQRSRNCAVKYRIEDLHAWQQARIRRNTSES